MPRTAGISSASAASRRAVPAEIGWSYPSIRASPSPETSASRSTRTTTVVFASGVSVCSQPRAWRAIAASPSAWSCGIDRRSSSTGRTPGTDDALGCASRCPSASRRRSASVTNASTAALIGAAVSGSSRALRCTTPCRSSRIVSERCSRSCSSRGSTPSASSLASASRTPRITISRGARSASSVSAASATSTRAGSARSATRSSIVLIAEAASRLIAARSSACATCARRGGIRSPEIDARAAVADPTEMRRAASLRDAPVDAATRRVALWNPCAFASPTSPNSGPDRLATSAAVRARSASTPRRSSASASVTRTSPASLICSGSTCAPPGSGPNAGIAALHASRSASSSRSRGVSGSSMLPSCTHPPTLESARIFVRTCVFPVERSARRRRVEDES
ncbi:hypothetical protein DSM26151_27870 [Agromyces marinus]|nr:hypothetical protein DSM26151_27870 [Agromyces marinus]